MIERKSEWENEIKKNWKRDKDERVKDRKREKHWEIVKERKRLIKSEIENEKEWKRKKDLKTVKERKRSRKSERKNEIKN